VTVSIETPHSLLKRNNVSIETFRLRLNFAMIAYDGQDSSQSASVRSHRSS